MTNPCSNVYYPSSHFLFPDVEKINKNKSSSNRLYSLKYKTVFSAHGDGWCTKENSVGGPGDKTPSVSPTFIGGLLRLKQSGKKGVDKKHGSYERYLAKKVANSQPCGGFYTVGSS